MSLQDQTYGIQELWRPPNGDPELDIVAVNGLDGNVLQTYTNRNGICWLNDPNFLPSYVKNARVLVWGHNATFASLLGSESSKEFLHHHATKLVANLAMDRRLSRTTNRPIIFLCHSLGGTIVKKALSYSETRKSQKISHEYDVYSSTSAILFFSTPHLGTSRTALLGYLQKVSSFTKPFSKSRSKAAVSAALERESEILQNINQDFVQMMKNFNIFYFWEKETTELPGIGKDFVVKHESAAPDLPDTERSGISASHFDMVKFGASTHPDFRMVIEALMRYSQEAQDAMLAKQQYNYNTLMRERQFEAESMMRRQQRDMMNFMPTNPWGSQPLSTQPQDLNQMTQANFRDVNRPERNFSDPGANDIVWSPQGVPQHPDERPQPSSLGDFRR